MKKNVKIVKCPHCGAKLEVWQGTTSVFCGFDIYSRPGCHESFNIVPPHKKGAKKND